MRTIKPLDAERLREQHLAAAVMIDRLLAFAGSCDDEDKAYGIALQVAKVASLLRIHFAQEDCSLYATLFDSGDPEVSRVGLDYYQELGGLAEKLEMFAFRWSSGTAIRHGFDRFRPELSELCGELTRRIALENAYLYPLAERVLAMRVAA